MKQTAKVFRNGRSQAVRIPAAFRFDATEVYIRKDATTGEVILTPKKKLGWDRVFELIDAADIPEDFLADRDKSPPQDRSNLLL